MIAETGIITANHIQRPGQWANTAGCGTSLLESVMQTHSTLVPYSDSFIQSFWARFDMESSPYGCWLWRGNIMVPAGYGRVQVNRKTVRIHRVSYELARGPIPDDLIIRHTCDGNYLFRDFTYRRCGPPSHLTTGTSAENSADMVAHERQVRGILAPKAKLVPWQVRAIRAAYLRGDVTYEELGAFFGVTKQSIRSIVERTSWRWLA
jgi:hypothetical protein